mgnify:CR=1 FL=1
MTKCERRRRTEAKSLRQLKIRVSHGWGTRLEAGYFKKWNAMSCRCRKHGRGCSPKLGASMCHGWGLHPAVVERIEGKRLCRDWWQDY